MNGKTTHVLFRLCFFVLLLCSPGCGDGEQRALREVVERNIKAAQEKNVDLYLADMTGPLKSAAEMVKGGFSKAYTPSFKLVSFKVLSIADNTAKVEVAIETRHPSGPAFRDSRTTAENLMKKEAERWKIAECKIVNVTYLR